MAFSYCELGYFFGDVNVLDLICNCYRSVIEDNRQQRLSDKVVQVFGKNHNQWSGQEN